MTAPEIPLTLDSLIRAVEQSAPDDRLTQLAHASATATQLGDLGDSLLGVFVDRCRRDGRSWSEIGTALGVTKQAVQKRFVGPALAGAHERFTQRARKVLEHAAEEARRLQQGYVGTEHLLLGLLDEPESIAAVVLGESGVTHSVVREALLAIVPMGTTPVTGEPTFTPRTARALELTLSCALRLGHNYIGTEHMLLALLEMNEGMAAEILAGHGVAQATVEAGVIELLSGYSAP
jgi:Clp amino terminal domain, pathogenicity island component